MRPVFLIALFVSILGYGWAISAAKADTIHSRMVMPFTPARNHGVPLIQIRFSNSLTGTFIVDTGCYDCLMSEKFARKAGLSLLPNSPTYTEISMRPAKA